MDIELTQSTDSRGNLIIDFAVGITPSESTLPVVNGVWLLDEMSEPSRFYVDYAEQLLDITDPAAFYGALSLVIFTDADRRNDYVKTLFGEREMYQRALMATYLQRGTIPSLPDTGNYMAELLTDQVTPSQFNARLVENIANLANTVSYRPSYAVTEKGLVVSVERQ